MKNKDYSEYFELYPDELRKLQQKRGWIMSFIGFVVYGVLRLFKQAPKAYKGICSYFEIGNGWGGVSLGWFFICCKDCGDSTKSHEVGHMVQTAANGGLIMLVLSICSAMRYWWRRIFGEKTPYDSWWFEGQASQIGKEYVSLHEKDY